MKWPPWKRDHGEPAPDPERARAHLERVRAQRPHVEAMARQIRESAERNNFISNTFKLVDPSGGKR